MACKNPRTFVVYWNHDGRASFSLTKACNAKDAAERAKNYPGWRETGDVKPYKGKYKRFFDSLGRK
jgi:hypothetical protein